MVFGPINKIENSLSSHQLANQSSGDVEYYTQKYIIELARNVLGEIELGPASNFIANRTVKAQRIFTRKENGLLQTWRGKVWMNHPFHKGEKACKKNCKKKNCIPSTNPKKPTRGHCITEDIPSNLQWIDKLVSEYRAGNVEEAICITFSSMSETWMKPLLEFPQCFPYGRIHYRKPDGTIERNVTKGSLITYLGPHPDRFAQVFSAIGKVK